MILAVAFAQVWDGAGAIAHWERAVDVAKTHHQPWIRTLMGRGTFYYNRGLPGDWDLGRDDFGAALRELIADPEKQGQNVASEQAVSLLVSRAGMELTIGDHQRATTLVDEALGRADSIVVSWRKKRSRIYIGAFVLQQGFVPVEPFGLPEELLQQGGRRVPTWGYADPSTVRHSLRPLSSAGMTRRRPRSSSAQMTRVGAFETMAIQWCRRRSGPQLGRFGGHDRRSGRRYPGGSGGGHRAESHLNGRSRQHVEAGSSSPGATLRSVAIPDRCAPI